MPSKIEKKLGKYAIPNLTLYLIIGYVVGYVIELVNPELYQYLTFEPHMILKGQIWRLFTWLFTTPQDLGIFTIIMLFLYYSLGTTLERTWGTYRYNVYLFSGFLFTALGSFFLYFALTAYFSLDMNMGVYSEQVAAIIGEYIAMYVSTFYVNMSIFFAFAVTYPNEKLYLYFIIPVKMKWLAVLDGGFIIYNIIAVFTIFSGDKFRTIASAIPIINTAVILFSLLNFLIYWLSGSMKKVGNAKRKKQFEKKIRHTEMNNTYENGARHKCVVCGRTELDDPNLVFRYCSKCSGGKEYCQEHLFTHTHS